MPKLVKHWKQLGTTLKALRKTQGLSAKEVVRDSDIYQRVDSLYRIESGARRPDRQKLVRILVDGLKVHDMSTLNEVLRLAAYASIGSQDIAVEPLRNIILSCNSVHDPAARSASSRTFRFSEPERFNAAIIEGRLRSKLLRLCYPDDQLAAVRLHRYAFSLNGQRITTSIVTKDAWLRLSIPVTENDAKRFPLQNCTFDRRTVSHSDEMRLRAELSEEGVRSNLLLAVVST